MKNMIQKPRGTRDILQDEQKYWKFIADTLERRAVSFGFGKIETPIMEAKDLYVRAIGETTDIIEKEMFEVKRSGQISSELEEDGGSLILRPEYTAGVVRSYIENGMQVLPQPVKLYSMGPVFRYDRPQKGRYRQFWQLNLEVIGDASPLSDALMILLIWQIFQDFGLKDRIIFDINSIGDKNCRPKIKKKVVEYFKKYKDKLCADCQRRLESNPFRIFDCKEEQCQKITAGAPQIVDNLCTDCRKHFTQVLEYLDEMAIPYDLNPRLVRGLDYYTRTTFEVREIVDEARQSSLGGGGRYDNLFETYGSKATPAVGFAGGIERIIEKMKQLEIKVPELKGADVYIVQIGDKAKKMGLSLVNMLGSKGIKASCSFGKDALKAQLKEASRMGARFALIIGQREALDKTVIVRNMEEASQETVDLKDLDTFLIRKLQNLE